MHTLEGIKRLAERAAALCPRHMYWQSVIGKGPLADNELGMVLDELQGVAERVLSEVVALIERGKFNALDVVLTDRTDYESLLGQMPSETAAAKHVQEVLAPHLLAVFRKNAHWGLRCVQAACISETVDPITAAEGVANDDLLSAIQTVGIGTTPSALVATHKPALSRALQGQSQQLAPASRRTVAPVAVDLAPYGNRRTPELLLWRQPPVNDLAPAAPQGSMAR